MLLSQLRAYSDAVTAADFERLCHTATEHVFVCVGPTVDGSRPCHAAWRTKNDLGGTTEWGGVLT